MLAAVPHAGADPTPSVQATPAPAATEPVVLRINKEGKVSFGREPGALSLDEMAARLQARQGKQGVEPNIILQAGEEAPYDSIVQVLDKLRAIGITHTAFAGGRRAEDRRPFPPPAVTASPAGSGTPPPVPPEELKGRGGRIKAAMMEARVREEKEDAGGAAARLSRMTPEEREAFNRNLRVWRDLPQEERTDLRQQANKRNREETMDALRESGLRLDNDQKEIFALRYLQERRKLEREIQEQANAERTRRLPLLLQGLKREFGANGATPVPTASPVVTPSPQVPAASPASAH